MMCIIYQPGSETGDEGIRHRRVPVDAGAIRPVIDRVFRFDETPAAMQRVESGRSRGKVVIQV
jgi:hypothetical protein